ncbi:MAG: hypothetical protein ACQSGP_13965 [Frankia sp.]
MTSSTTAAPSPAAGFSITVPDTWFEIDVDPATRSASINALVRSRTRGVPALEARRDEIAQLLRAAAREAAASGAVYCGVMVEPVEGTGLTASVTVSLLPPADANLRLDTAAAIAATLHEKTARNPNDTWTAVSVIDLPGIGPAARAAGVEDVEMPDGSGWIRATLMQTFVPVPGGDGVALISCSSPNIVLVEPLHDLFDAVSGTFRFLGAAT